MEKKFSIEIGGQLMTFEMGKVAKQANGAVVAQVGDTVVLTTACINDTPRTGIDFFPLVVDFEERYYSAGKIPGGFIKREGRPTETAILSARVVDRSIRSLFDENLRYEVQVVATVLSVDQLNPPSVLAINAASAALMISEIPWGGPIGAVRIGYIDDQLVVNPTEEMMANSKLDLLVSGHKDGITMVEAGANEVSEELLVDALDLAHAEIKKIVALQEEMRKEMGKEKVEIPAPEVLPDIDQWLHESMQQSVYEAVCIHKKKPRADRIQSIKDTAIDRFAETYPESEGYISAAVDEMVKKTMRARILDEHVRVDGRAMNQIRPITCEVDVLPRVHGSALFTRGETQALVVATLGMMGVDDQILDGLKQDEPNKRFILHYNFPPYSVGEVRPMRGPGRREIGHGALAERALRPMIPDEVDFPYVVRIVSDILESNGSSSQASICGGSLALMAAGVPIKKHVAGIAMGLIKEGEKVEILTDIQGLEDHYGDMDFKVAGTRDGVTALQMDNKAGGITRDILKKALNQAQEGRMTILNIMGSAISQPTELSPYAPRIYVTHIDPEKIRDVIGPGGKMIRSITQESGAKINIEDSGEVYIASTTSEGVEKALAMIRGLTKELEPGEIYLGKVTRIMNFGAFVECLPGKEGLLHISEISPHRVGKVEDVFSVGDAVLVMVKEIDDMGRTNLTRKKLFDQEDRVVKEGFASSLNEEKTRETLIASQVAAAAATRPTSTGRRTGGYDRSGKERGGQDRRSQGDPRR